MRFRQMVIIALIGLLLSMHLPKGESRLNGIENVKNGCVCHSATSSPEVQITLEGMPEKYESNITYHLRISVEGGATPVENATNTAGFNLWFHNGLLSPKSNDSQLTDGLQLTHTEHGNDQRSWNVTWTSPNDDSLNVDWRLTVNTVNGDGWEFKNQQTSSGDMWNQISGTVIGVNGTAVKAISPLIIYGVPIGFLVLSIVCYILVTRDARVAVNEQEDE